LQMTRSPFALITLLSLVAVAAAGCAHQPPASVSGELNVMQLAREMGYSTPEVIDGKTLFCANEELTGSMVPKVACIDSDEVVAKARAQGDLLRTLQTPTDATSRPASGGPASGGPGSGGPG
jgi:hypothetical protein